MDIAPNTDLMILKNCPLDTQYNNTLYWANATAQYNYFYSLAKVTYANLTYQRVNKGVVRVQVNTAYPLNTINDCNYMMFRNTSFGSKWFYAFILKIEYVNNITFDISYQIDVMQTYFFDYTLKQCFVVREHSATDAVGDNLQPEQLEIGEYVADDYVKTGHFDNYKIVVAAPYDRGLNVIDGTAYSGIIGQIYYITYDFAFTTPQSDGIVGFLAWMNTAGPGQILNAYGCFLYPTDFVTDPWIVDGQGVAYAIPQMRSYTIQITKKIAGAIDGYTPKNKKLYTYPYNFLYVTNLQGNSAEYRYEYFSTINANFELTGDFSINPHFFFAPKGYKGVSSSTVNWDERLTMSGFPQLPVACDTFKNWLANTAISGVISAAQAGSGKMIGGNPNLMDAIYAAGRSASATSIEIAVRGALQKSDSPYKMTAQGTGAGSAYTLASLRALDFVYQHKHVTAEYAKVIDDYFTRFGYACNKTKVPSIANRPIWNYVKTQGCCILASCPADDAKAIEEIYDRGVTFWKDASKVGDYSGNNAPT